MSQQTTVDIYMGKAFAGLIADIRPREVDSKIWEDTTDGVYGVFVARGTGDSQVILPAVSTAEIIGPVIAHQNIELDRGVTQIAIEEGDIINVMRTGNIYVTTEDACVPGDGVFVRYASGAGGTQLGAVRTAAVTDETIDLSSEWEYEETGAAGDVVKIRKK